MANRGPFVILSRVKKCTKILPHRATILFIQVFSFFVCFSDQRAVKILSVRFRPDRISSCDFSKSKQQQSFSSYYCLRSNALRTMCGKIRFILRAVSSPAPAAAVVYQVYQYVPTQRCPPSALLLVSRPEPAPSDCSLATDRRATRRLRVGCDATWLYNCCVATQLVDRSGAG